MAAINLAWAPSSGATKYSVYRSPSAGARGVSLGDVTGTSFSDGTAIPGTAYWYGVTASNATGESALSAQATATVPQVPAVPTGLTATVV